MSRNNQTYTEQVEGLLESHGEKFNNMAKVLILRLNDMLDLATNSSGEIDYDDTVTVAMKAGEVESLMIATP